MFVTTIEFEKALNSLQRVLLEPKSDITRDAAIQRFEFCVELAWKTAKKVMGTSSAAPRAIVREMASAQLIQDPAKWFGFLDARNQSSHTYREEIAERVLTVAHDFLPEGQKLLAKMNSALV